MHKLPERKRIVVLLVLLILHEFIANSGRIYKNYGFSFSLYFRFFELGIAFILFWLYKNSKEIGIWLIFCGGVVNYLDRIRYGYVRDYWFVPGLQVYNNLADWVIFAGIILVWRYYMKTRTF